MSMSFTKSSPLIFETPQGREILMIDRSQDRSSRAAIRSWRRRSRWSWTRSSPST